MKFYPRIKRNELLIDPITWVNLKHNIQSLISKTQKTLDYVISLYDILATANLSRQKTTELFPRAWSEGAGWLQKGDQGLHILLSLLNFR